MHIHNGLSCETSALQGGHYFVDPVMSDPWVDDRYSTDYAGVATFAGAATIGTDKVEGRAFIVHGRNGERLACGLLKDITPEEDVKNCKNDYECPVNSYRKPGRKCYDSFDDCECDNNFVRFDDSCGLFVNV